MVKISWWVPIRRKKIAAFPLTCWKKLFFENVASSKYVGETLFLFFIFFFSRKEQGRVSTFMKIHKLLWVGADKKIAESGFWNRVGNTAFFFFFFTPNWDSVGTFWHSSAYRCVNSQLRQCDVKTTLFAVLSEKKNWPLSHPCTRQCLVQSVPRPYSECLIFMWGTEERCKYPYQALVGGGCVCVWGGGGGG